MVDKYPFILKTCIFLSLFGYKCNAPPITRLDAVVNSSLCLDTLSLNTGDLILRNGKGFISECARNFNQKEKKYSHSGLLTFENNLPFVYHAIGGESNFQDGLKKTPLDVFIHPEICSAFGVYRYQLSPDQHSKTDSLLRMWNEKKIGFDLDLDLSTQDKMYCSELIYKAMMITTGNKNFLSLTYVNQKPYISIDNLYLNEHTIKIFEYEYLP